MLALKVVVVGDSGVGKTYMLVSFIHTGFPRGSIPAVLDIHSCGYLVDGKPINLALWDTAGEEGNDRMRPLYYPATDLFLVCYSVGSRTSFEATRTKWVPEVRRHNPKTPIILAGTKVDLRDKASTSDRLQETAVTAEEGEAMAKAVGACAYVENSALTLKGVRNTFDVVVHTAEKTAGKTKPRAKMQNERSCSVM